MNFKDTKCKEGAVGPKGEPGEPGIPWEKLQGEPCENTQPYGEEENYGHEN